jgi:hypothetical protein
MTSQTFLILFEYCVFSPFFFLAKCTPATHD